MKKNLQIAVPLLNDGQWHSIALIWQDGKVVEYVDGKRLYNPRRQSERRRHRALNQQRKKRC